MQALWDEPATFEAFKMLQSSTERAIINTDANLALISKVEKAILNRSSDHMV